MTLYGIRGGQMILNRLGYDPYIFVLCLVGYIVIHLCVHYMGYHGITWYLRKNN